MCNCTDVIKSKNVFVNTLFLREGYFYITYDALIAFIYLKQIQLTQNYGLFCKKRGHIHSTCAK